MIDRKQYYKWMLLLTVSLILISLKGQLIDQIVPVTRIFYGTPAPGYMFITPTPLDMADNPSALAILDHQGNPVFYKSFIKEQNGQYLPVMVSDFKLQPSGLMSYAIQRSTGDLIIYLLDTNFVRVDSISNINDVQTDGHDFIHLPDGTYHLVGTEARIIDCSSLLTNNGVPGSVNATVVGNVIQRFNPNKTLDFEWRSLDHFDLGDVYSQYFTNPNLLDHSHYNSIDIDADGNYLLSFRHLNEITKVNASTGEIIWRLGGKASVFTFVGDTMPFSAQHDARRIENGNLTIFDNGEYNSIPCARAIEYDLNEENFTATAVWQFPEPNGLPSAFIGSMRRQTNRNTLIDWGGAFPLSESVSFIEVDPDGNVVMEFDFDDDLFVSYRAIKEELPFDLPRPVLTCDGESNSLNAPDGYAYYEWNTGDYAQTIVVEDTGMYQVWVNQGIGYVCSEPFYVADLMNICGEQSLQKELSMHWCIFPNPAIDKVYINIQTQSEIDALNCYNQFGQRVLHQERNREFLDVSKLDAGVYFVELISEDKSVIQKLVISK